MYFQETCFGHFGVRVPPEGFAGEGDERGMAWGQEGGEKDDGEALWNWAPGRSEACLQAHLSPFKLRGRVVCE